MKCSEKEEQEASVFTATTSSPNVSAVEREKKSDKYLVLLIVKQK